jgi:hypothetical protein
VTVLSNEVESARVEFVGQFSDFDGAVGLRSP